MENWQIQAEQFAERTADAQAQLLELKGQGHYEWAARLAEAQADVRALAEALQMQRTHGHTQSAAGIGRSNFHWCTSCESRRDNALARPGVVRLLAEKE